MTAGCLLHGYAAAQSPSEGSPAKPLVLQKNEGEVRTRRPRNGVASPSSDFVLKVGPKTSGSKHLLLGTEEIAPGAVIPKHKHHGEEEILLIEPEVRMCGWETRNTTPNPAPLVFIPSDTWIGLKNTGSQNIQLVFVWNEPNFEDMMRCASVPKGQAAPPISREEVQACYQHGDGELE